MANKEKLLAAAQKSLQKGQISKAIKDYQKVVDADPKDMRNRQKLAELYSRAHMSDDALAEYEAVAKYYAENGFYLKSIAVYKQMQKLDPDRVGIYHRLAELNEKQGLVGNALAEYRNLVAYYEKHEMSSEAINVLQKMKDLDPENLNIRVKIAESMAHGGMKEKARTEFEEVLELLEKRNDFDRSVKLYELLLPLFPEDLTFRIGFAQTLIEHGESEKGIDLLRSLLKDNPGHQAILHALAGGYRKEGDFENERLTFHHLLKQLPDDLELREGYVRSCLADGEYRRALEELEEWKGAFFDHDRVSVLKPFYEELQTHLDDEQVLRTLNTIYERTGEGDKLFAVMSALPEETLREDLPEADAVDDTEALADLEDVVEDLEEIEVQTSEAEAPEEAVPALPGDLPGGEPEAAAPEEEIEEIPLEFLKEVEDLGEESEAPPEPGPFVDGSEQDMELEVELDLDFDDELPELLEESDLLDGGDEETPEAAAVPPEADGEDENVLDLDLTEIMGESEEPAHAGTDPREELEEAEFYLQQGLLDEAERVCLALQKNAPEYAPLRELLAEIDRRRNAPAGEQEEQFFDLASEILDEGTQPEADAAEPAVEPDRFPLDGDFSEPPSAELEQVDSEDCESHYNLGIAYKEMGLLEDAVAEFDNAMRSPARRLDCLTLKGICLTEKGDFPLAEETLQRGLGEESLTEGERISLHYELGLLYENWGRPEQALESFQQVAGVDPFFRNAGENVQRLRKALGLEGDPGDGNGNKSGKDRVSYI